MVKPIEEIIVTKPAVGGGLERKTRPQKDQAINCPRCNSTNTKFCYYNNYSLTQPRYFCKTCRRYWTEGGSLRNIPVGGGSRKNKRSSASSSNSTSSKRLPDLVTPTPPPQVCNLSSQKPKSYIHVPHDGQDLNLTFPSSQGFSFRPISENKDKVIIPTTSQSQQLLSSFMPMPVPDPNTVFPSGFPMHNFKPTLNFSLDLDGLGNNYGSLQGVQETTNGRLLFPFEDLKQVSSTPDVEPNREQGDSPGYWTGMLGGGSSW